jgi:hypothetical protein
VHEQGVARVSTQSGSDGIKRHVERKHSTHAVDGDTRAARTRLDPVATALGTDINSAPSGQPLFLGR